MQTPIAIAADTARGLVLDALRAGGETEVPEADDLAAVELSRVRQLPAWVARAGMLRSAGTWWLYVERARDQPAGGFEPGQVVLDLPAGRYEIGTLDVRARRWVALESATGGPVVAGLACPGDAAVLRVRHLAGVS